MNLDSNNSPFGDDTSSSSAASFAAQLAGGGDDGGYVVEQPKSRVGGTTLAFIGLAAIAAGGLWLMRQRAGVTPAVASAAVVDPQQEAARASIQQFLAGGSSEVEQMKNLLADTQAIQDRFIAFSDSKQVPLEELKTNPFWHEAAEEDTTDDDASQDWKEEERVARAQEQLRLEQQRLIATDAGSLKLATIILGSRPSCIINGTICRVGSTIDKFTVVGIRADEVDVRRDGYEFTLKLNK